MSTVETKNYNLTQVKKELNKYGINTECLQQLAYLSFNNHDYKSLMEPDINPDSVSVSPLFIHPLAQPKRTIKALTKLKIFNLGIFYNNPGELSYLVTARTPQGHLVSFDIKANADVKGVKDVYVYVTAVAVMEIVRVLTNGEYRNKEQLRLTVSEDMLKQLNVEEILKSMQTQDDVKYMAEKFTVTDDVKCITDPTVPSYTGTSDAQDEFGSVLKIMDHYSEIKQHNAVNPEQLGKPEFGADMLMTANINRNLDMDNEPVVSISYPDEDDVVEGDYTETARVSTGLGLSPKWNTEIKPDAVGL